MEKIVNGLEMTILKNLANFLKYTNYDVAPVTIDNIVVSKT